MSKTTKEKNNLAVKCQGTWILEEKSQIWSD